MQRWADLGPFIFSTTGTTALVQSCPAFTSILAFSFLQLAFHSNADVAVPQPQALARRTKFSTGSPYSS
eukprot:SAG11_NODE_16429_length_547_cov_1.732143_1_plen_68_part_10